MEHLVYRGPLDEASSAYRISRRQVIVGAGLQVVVGSLGLVSASHVQSMGLPQFRRYYSQHLEGERNLWVVQAVDFTLSQATAPGTHNLLVLADELTIDGDVSMPGLDLTLVARRIRVSRGAATLSTAGSVGTPSYTGSTAAQGQRGATDTGAGKDGGAISIYATDLEGVLTLNSSGGKGGDAQNGGRGLPGTDGKPGTFESPPTAAGNGQPGKGAGVPGNGGNAGSILVWTERQAAKAIMQALPGAAGLPASNGDPGPPGAPAGPARGREPSVTTCYYDYPT